MDAKTLQICSAEEGGKDESTMPPDGEDRAMERPCRAADCFRGKQVRVLRVAESLLLLYQSALYRSHHPPPFSPRTSRRRDLHSLLSEEELAHTGHD